MELESILAGGAPPAGRWTTLAQWREMDGALFAIFDHHDARSALDLLHFGLEQLQGRTLCLVLPVEACEASRYRAAFLSAEVVVFENDGGELRELPRASREDALDWYRQLGAVTDIVAPDEFPRSPEWLVDLVDWVESRRVERVRRTQYWAWHYRGRQILKVNDPTMHGYSLVAGVNYSSPTGDQPPPEPLTVGTNEIPDPDALRRVREAVDGAIERRRTGIDRDHREHLLQAALGLEPGLLGLSELLREYPAWRPGLGGVGGRGFVDFLGVDVDGGLHVVETKIGPDAALGIQGLDYWAWVTAHRSTIAEHVDAESPDASVALHYVVARSDKRLMHAAAAATLPQLDGIEWRCHVVTDWNTVDRPRQLLRPRALGTRPNAVPDLS